MFARIVPVRNGKVYINGVEMTVEEALKLDEVSGVGEDEKGNMYVILKN